MLALLVLALVWRYLCRCLLRCAAHAQSCTFFLMQCPTLPSLCFLRYSALMRQVHVPTWLKTITTQQNNMWHSTTRPNRSHSNKSKRLETGFQS